MTALLRAENIGRTYPGVVALSDVTLEVRPGEVHAICGENGAGKSTLLKILVGAEQPDSGRLLWKGEEISIASPRVAGLLGISMVHQELHLTPQLSVAENVFAGMLPRRGKAFVDWRTLHRRTQEVLRRLQCGFSSTESVASLSVAQRQLVEIAKALVRDSSVVILDEPTAPLTSLETTALLDLVRRLQADGVAILYVSHRLSEVFEIADTVTVLRDGHQISTRPAAGTSAGVVVREMVGRDVDLEVGALTDPSEDVRLEVRGLTRKGAFSDISFSLRGGEIVGMYGLIGSGRTEVARAVVGLDPYDTGAVVVDGARLARPTPAQALRRGIAYLSEDRKGVGLVLPLSVGRNLALPSLGRLNLAGFMRPRAQSALVEKAIRSLRVRPASPSRLAKTLSGGNQQKVALGKWLATRPRVLLLDEPTRGIDVGAKQEIYQIIRDLAAEGMSVLLISSELPEVVHLPHRVLVMRSGTIAGEVMHDDVSEERLVSIAVSSSALSLEGPR